jgi:uncharacterized protein
MRPFSLLIKPASADCNLRCDYCFYLIRSELYPDTKVHRMSEKVLDRMISSYMATEQPQYAFGWQGGEPTLMGLDFYKKVVELQQKYGSEGKIVTNGLQTNSILIDDEFAEHLAKYKFLVGVSLDGPEQYHDKYRKDLSGQGTHSAVMKAVKTLKRHSAEFNILCLVNAKNVKAPREIYEYYVENGFYFQQFIPCVEFDSNNNPLPFAINGKQWGEFMCEIFDIWYKADTRKVSIRLFDSILNLLVDNIRNVCHMGRNCCQYFVVEYNGDIYPCDFFVRDYLKVGNINDDSWNGLQQAGVYKDFGKQKALWQDKCSNCEYLYICSGDCLKHRVYGTITSPQNLSWLCEGWKMFFSHTLPRLKKLAEKIREERQREQARILARQNPAIFKNVGRNEPCPCGSGKKYKKCCGK